MIEIEIDKLSLQETLQLLTHLSDGANVALSRTINKTAPGVLTDASKRIRLDLNVKAAQVKDEVRKTPYSTPKSLRKFVKWSRDPFPATDQYVYPKLFFSGKKLSKGYSFQFKRGRGTVKFKTAFAAKMRSGHTNIWIRSGKKLRTGRDEIKGIFSTSPTDILSNEDVLKYVIDNANDRMLKNLQNQVDYLLSK